MLLSLLFRRGTGSSRNDAFRVRGEGVSRVEGFSDTVFGFAITLLVISAGVPKTSIELLDMRHSVLPFVASFFVLFTLWRIQFDFFRRYGLEDRRTVNLTGVLLMLVLFAIYPVKFLCTFMFDVLPVALIAHDDSMRAMMPLGNLPKVLLMYAIGFAGVMAIFALLYRHAAQSRDALGLSELELLDTLALEVRFRNSAVVGCTLALWCVLMLVMLARADHVRRDVIWWTGYALLPVAVFAVRFRQRHETRRLEGRRRDLVQPPPAGGDYAGIA